MKSAKEINKIICIGANCIAANFTKSLGIRKKGPMDNIANFPISKAYLLFNNEIKKAFFKYKYEKRKSTEKEKNIFHYEDSVFSFKHGFSVVHNDFSKLSFRISLRKRILAFQRYYKKSIKDTSLWYVYSLNSEDEYLTDIDLIKIYKTLPKCCTSRLICLGIRAHNSLFEKYFNFYIELDNEKEFKWHDETQARILANELQEKYGIKINSKMKKL